MNRIALMICSVPFVLGMGSTAHAQGTVDMSKYTCEKLLKGTANSIEAAIWLSGYYNGQRGNTMLDTQELTANAQKLRDYCIMHPEVPILRAVEALVTAK